MARDYSEPLADREEYVAWLIARALLTQADATVRIVSATRASAKRISRRVAWIVKDLLPADAVGEALK